MCGISSLPKPPGMIPIVCFAEESMPLMMSPLCIPEGDKTGIRMGSIGVSIKNGAKIMLIGSIELLVQCKANVGEGTVLIENMLRWASGNLPKVMLLGLPEHMNALIKKNISECGYKASIATDPTGVIQRRNVVICTDDCPFIEELKEFVENGGGLICCHRPDATRTPMASYLSTMGISFMDCGLIVGRIHTTVLEAKHSFNQLRETCFDCQADKYIEAVSSANVSIQDLDILTTPLKWYIQAMPKDYTPRIAEVHEAAWNFLTRNEHWVSEEGFCSHVEESITSVLLVETTQKLPCSYWVGKNMGEVFPGKSNADILSGEKVVAAFNAEGWASTGLWAPAGVMCKVRIENGVSGIRLQIGAHESALVSKDGPWRRWPFIISLFDLPENGELEFCSPFGGLIYLTLDEEPLEQVVVEVEFSNVCMCPRYHHEHGNLWNETCKLDVPFGEIETGTVTFTVPSNVLRMIKSINEPVRRFDALVGEIHSFLASDIATNHRIVFDVDLPNDIPICGYPIVLPIEAAEIILLETAPTPELFSTLAFIGVMSMPLEDFSEDQETALANLAVVIAMRKFWPHENPLDYAPDIMTKYLDQLLNICTELGSDKVTDALQATKQVKEMGSQRSQNDYWMDFVKYLSIGCNRDLQELLELRQKTEKRNVLMSCSSASLSEYVLSEACLSGRSA